MNYASAIAAILASFWILLIASTLGFILYILNSVALHKIGKRQGISWSWIAWIPFLNIILLAKIAYDNLLLQILMPLLSFFGGDKETTKVDNTEITTGFFNAPIGSILSLAYTILTFMCAYQIYKRYSKSYVAMTVLTVLSLGLLTPIFLFAIRNNKKTKN